jgi:hypothetical protein
MPSEIVHVFFSVSFWRQDSVNKVPTSNSELCCRTRIFTPDSIKSKKRPRFCQRLHWRVVFVDGGRSVFCLSSYETGERRKFYKLSWEQIPLFEANFHWKDPRLQPAHAHNEDPQRGSNLCSLWRWLPVAAGTSLVPQIFKSNEMQLFNPSKYNADIWILVSRPFESR